MTDWKKIYQEIEKADSIMLTTHENPDGDGIGSIVALYQHLKGKEKKKSDIAYFKITRRISIFRF